MSKMSNEEYKIRNLSNTETISTACPVCEASLRDSSHYNSTYLNEEYHSFYECSICKSRWKEKYKFQGYEIVK